MINWNYPIKFEFPKTKKTFDTTAQKLYQEMSDQERSDFLKPKYEKNCTVTCHCQSKHPVRLQLCAHDKKTYYLRRQAKEGCLHRPDCYWFCPPSEQHEFWDNEQRVIKLPFNIEKKTYQKQSDSPSTKGSSSTNYRPTFKQFSEQLFIQAHTHFLNTALKKGDSIIPTPKQFYFYLGLKLKQFELNEGILLSELFLETPTFSMIQKQQKELASRFLLNWEQARFFICHFLSDLQRFEWKGKTYTALSLKSPQTNKSYHLAYKGDLIQELETKFRQPLSNLQANGQLWFVGWIPTQQKNVPTFKEKKLPVLSSDSKLDSQVICLASNGCLAQNADELNVFNQFAKANEPLRCCFYGESPDHTPVKGDWFPNALWIQTPTQKRTHQAICIFPPGRNEAKTKKQLIKFQEDERNPSLWIWDLKVTKEMPILPFKTK